MLRRAVIAVLAVTAFAVIPAAASAATSVSVTVLGTSGPASQGGTGYTDTGVTLAADHQVQVAASGTWCAGWSWCFGPDGIGQPGGAGNPAPDLTGGSLIATLDGGATWQEVGSGPATLTGPGTVTLAFNDSWYGDNGGSVTATITYLPPNGEHQCKNGGWANYGGMFKNQGDCVSYVAGGDKTQPSGS